MANTTREIALEAALKLKSALLDARTLLHEARVIEKYLDELDDRGERPRPLGVVPGTGCNAIVR